MSTVSGWSLPGDQVPTDATFSWGLALYFDDEGAAVVDAWRETLGKHGWCDGGELSGRPPHITLACTTGIPDGAPPTPPASVTVATVGAFPSALGLVAALPTPSPPLVAHHAAVHRWCGDGGVASFDYYSPGLWVPHISLVGGLSPQRIGQAVALLLPQMPVRLRVDRLAAFCFDGGPAQPLASPVGGGC